VLDESGSGNAGDRPTLTGITAVDGRVFAQGWGSSVFPDSCSLDLGLLGLLLLRGAKNLSLRLVCFQLLFAS